LGIKFLKHIKRTKALVHCVSADSKNPLKDYKDVRKELGDYDKELLLKPELILITKSDLASKEDLKNIKEKLKETKKEVLPVSIYDYDQMQTVRERLKKLA
jgi:GTP-binding protein